MEQSSHCLQLSVAAQWREYPRSDAGQLHCDSIGCGECAWRQRDGDRAWWKHKRARWTDFGVDRVVAVGVVVVLARSRRCTPTLWHRTTASPAGNDSNSGLDAAHPWATPNHAVVCGDVIIAAAGSYSGFSNNVGAVSNCPSSTGGIDGTGGIYFAVVLCGSASVGDCFIAHAGASTPGFEVDGNNSVGNWAIEGFAINHARYGVGVQTGTCTGSTNPVQNVAVVNDIITNSGVGVNLGNCSGSSSVASLTILPQSAALSSIATSMPLAYRQ